MPSSLEKNNPLNEKQLHSVTLEDKTNALVLAGAGSGKTRVLTHRIKYLITQKQYDIDSILAVTFTNKAAKEMRDRLSELLLRPVDRIWVGTFHSIAHRILRSHPIEAGLSSNFQIIDQQDQFRIIKRLMKENSIDESILPIRRAQWFINKNKEEGVEPNEIEAGYDFFIKKNIEIFGLYNNYCEDNELLDFAGLLLKNYQLLQKNKSILDYYQNKFKNILIDEFQDTNNIQYKWVNILYKNNNVFFVGDEDQSIYGWRGANIENIQKAVKDFEPIEVIKLEQNYRSTGNILNAANAVISNNNNRIKKSLWTNSGDGDLINIYNATTEYDEAQYAVDIIKNNFTNNAGSLADNAILYRSNAQSRVFEEILIKEKLEYTIYGGLRFFERAEIKDAMSYIRLIENQNDNIAFERIVNFPTRGIGLATIDKIRNHSTKKNISFLQAGNEIITQLPTRAANALKSFIDMIDSIITDTKNLELNEKINHIIHQSGLIQHYEKNKTDKANSKKENLEELVSAAKLYQHDEESELSETASFIVMATLETDSQQNKRNIECMQLMTVHSAKGLEFENVFLVGMEDNLFPSIQSKDESHLINEERRLFYVGITRAMKNLHISYADRRFINGQSFYSTSSRFLAEIPDKFINFTKNLQKEYHTREYSKEKYNTSAYSTDIKKTSNKTSPNNDKYYIGRSVKHTKFGLGAIINIEGSGQDLRLQIEFRKSGTKWLIDAYAKLEFL